MKLVKNFLKKFGGPILWGRKSYSQEGEDLIVERMVSKRSGFYVDVGCHHPFRFSNTYLFYKKGWNGIGIDALPGTNKLFRMWRPRDIIVEMGISNTPGLLTYYGFNEPALNTFDAELADQRNGDKNYRLISKTAVRTDTLGAILKKLNCPQEFDLLSVDVEGFDLIALRSLDWEHFHPKIIIAECYLDGLRNITEDPIFLFLTKQGYFATAKSGHSTIFARKMAESQMGI
jgi:FkbM family methyltransferase